MSLNDFGPRIQQLGLINIANSSMFTRLIWHAHCSRSNGCTFRIMMIEMTATIQRRRRGPWRREAFSRLSASTAASRITSLIQSLTLRWCLIAMIDIFMMMMMMSMMISVGYWRPRRRRGRKRRRIGIVLVFREALVAIFMRFARF